MEFDKSTDTQAARKVRETQGHTDGHTDRQPSQRKEDMGKGLRVLITVTKADGIRQDYKRFLGDGMNLRTHTTNKQQQRDGSVRKGMFIWDVK